MDLEFRSDNFTFTDSTGGGVEISLSFKSYSLENLLLIMLTLELITNLFVNKAGIDVGNYFEFIIIINPFKLI